MSSDETILSTWNPKNQSLYRHNKNFWPTITGSLQYLCTVFIKKGPDYQKINKKIKYKEIRFVENITGRCQRYNKTKKDRYHNGQKKKKKKSTKHYTEN
jgi:hypothetical protein